MVVGKGCDGEKFAGFCAVLLCLRRPRWSPTTRRELFLILKIGCGAAQPLPPRTLAHDGFMILVRLFLSLLRAAVCDDD
jgi:hypothetical protein